MNLCPRMICLGPVALVAMLVVTPAIANAGQATAAEHPQEDIPAAASTDSETVADAVLRVRMAVAESRRQLEEAKAEGAARRAEAALRHEKMQAQRSSQRAQTPPRPPPPPTLPDWLTLLAIATAAPFLVYFARIMLLGVFAVLLKISGRTVQGHVVENVTRFGLLRRARYEFWTPMGIRHGYLPSAWMIGETLPIVYDPGNCAVHRPRAWLGADMLNALTLGFVPALKLPVYFAVAVFRAFTLLNKPRTGGAV